jgi:hypothetical protein
MWSIDLFTIRLREQGGTNILFYKVKNELKGFYPPISFSIPEIENVQHAIKESYHSVFLRLKICNMQLKNPIS